MNFIIPAAGFGLRSSSEKPLLLTKFEDDEYLYEKQISAIRRIYPNARIIYITGFNCDKIDKRILMHDCEVIHNLNYQNTSTAYSIGLALSLIKESAYVVYGNLFFDKKLLINLPKYDKIQEEFSESPSYILTNTQLEKNVGITSENTFNYHCNKKWIKILILSPNIIQYFVKETQSKPWKLTHEILEILMREFVFKQIEIKEFVSEIHKIKDIKEINGFLRKQK